MCRFPLPPVVLQDLVPLLGQTPAYPNGNIWQITKQGKGTGDHLLPLGDWLLDLSTSLILQRRSEDERHWVLSLRPLFALLFVRRHRSSLLRGKHGWKRQFENSGNFMTLMTTGWQRDGASDAYMAMVETRSKTFVFTWIWLTCIGPYERKIVMRQFNPMVWRFVSTPLRLESAAVELNETIVKMALIFIQIIDEPLVYTISPRDLRAINRKQPRL